MTRAIVGVSGCIVVGIGVYATQNPNTLWALILVGGMIGVCDEK